MPPYPVNCLTVVALWLALLAAPSRGEDSNGHILERGGRKLEVQISTEYDPAMQQDMRQWIQFISDALLQVYGHWPRENWLITVAPVSGASDDPIPWAQVHRDDVDSVEFFTNGKATIDELKRAWTGYHELAHLLIPYRGWGDAWFSEGLASYYQNILQARAGILTEQEMWQKLYEGYQRGLADTKFEGRELRVVSDKLRQDGGFMRVYWSGAWYFMVADARLRQQSRGRHNLDEALKKLNQCCADRAMSVPDMVSKLDQLNRVLLFQPLYEQVIVSTEIPPFEPIFASMGISIADGKVQLQNEGPGAHLRQQIVAGKPL